MNPSSQFLEMVRQAYYSTPVADLRPGERLHYCPVCGRDTPHTVEDLDQCREVFTCRCGNPLVYTVR